ncbi:multidrug effflux MFS transporter [Weeksellaceae bacterium KMM 9713]|uniref:Multidrug effflux MFS transporter n=1 Tax=Profundicola chukchiensis TaxID=2961959 RepID=A0A9X4RVC7_9FLAO|nr:multidrug effflux MFS transporter [Profundicola chukchiensis]MDG4947038.1 multidrug effflux MFS transporter [Profundicola chukchiensis]
MEITSREKLILVLILGSIAALGPFTVDMYLPAFPAIADDLSTSLKVMSYTLTSYFLGISIGQLIYGPIIDKYGRKPPLLIGLAIYSIASFCIIFSPNIDTMIVLRFVQALGASVGMVASMSIVRDIFKGKEIAKMLTNIMLVMGVAPVIAPTLGGLFLDNFKWEAIFFFLFAISAVVLIAVYFLLKETTGYQPDVKLRFVSSVKNYYITLQNKAFTKFTISGSMAMAFLFCYIASIPFIFMTWYEVSQQNFGLLFGMNAFGLIIGSQVNRVLLKKFNLIYITNVVFVIMLIVMLGLLIAFYITTVNLVAFAITIFFIMFLIGFLNPNSMALAMDNVDKNIGLASALNGSFRMASGAVASAAIAIFFDGTPMPFVWFIFILMSLSFALHLWAMKGSKVAE